jgi:rhomboid-like protein
VVKFLIGMNVAVFGLWFVGTWTNSEPILHFMIENFLVSWTALAEGRPWVLITSVFSHNLFIHLFINMFVLQGFGTALSQLLGWRRFLAFYLIAGVISSFSHAAVSAFVLDQPDLPALGASGSVAGVILVFSLLFPREKILLFGIIPMPAIVGAFLFIGLDLWGLFAQAGGGGLPIGHGAHLGGAFTGAVYYFFRLRKLRAMAYFS